MFEGRAPDGLLLELLARGALPDILGPLLAHLSQRLLERLAFLGEPRSLGPRRRCRDVLGFAAEGRALLPQAGHPQLQQ